VRSVTVLDSPELQTKEVGLLYNQVTVGLAATSINATILAFVFWDKVSHATVVGWFGCAELVVLLRYALLVRYRSSSEVSRRSADWGRWFLLGTALSALSWGTAGVLLYVTRSLAHQVFLAFVLGGMTAGAVAAYSASFWVFVSFAVPTLSPIILRFILERDEIHLTMAGMGLVFLFLMLDSSRRIHRTVSNSLRLELENENLISEVKVEAKQVRRLNEELKAEITEREAIQEELQKARDLLEERVEERTAELSRALTEVKQLSGLLPICSACKKIRDDRGSWRQLEIYIREHSEAEFTHSLCPECAKRMFEGFA
jgi:hypothetical protein